MKNGILSVKKLFLLGIRPATYFEKYVPGIFRRLYCEAIASP